MGAGALMPVIVKRPTSPEHFIRGEDYRIRYTDGETLLAEVIARYEGEMSSRGRGEPLEVMFSMEIKFSKDRHPLPIPFPAMMRIQHVKRKR